MSTPRAGQPGAARVCPHCKAIVLESAAVCPGCRHHLRFNTAGKQPGAADDGYRALSVDGTIAHKPAAESCEYCIVLDITNERGERLVRQVVGVGALQPGELRRLNLSVDMLPVGLPLAKPQTVTPAPGPSSSARVNGAAAGRATPGTPPPLQPPPLQPLPGRGPAPSAGAPAAAAKAAAAPAAAPPAPGAAPKVPNIGPGGTLGQRLRIFRKP